MVKVDIPHKNEEEEEPWTKVMWAGSKFSITESLFSRGKNTQAVLASHGSNVHEFQVSQDCCRRLVPQQHSSNISYHNILTVSNCIKH